jgi:hypothetical protein
MKKTIFITLGIIIISGLLLLIVIVGVIRFNFNPGGDVLSGKNPPDVKNMSYVVDGETFILKDGKAEKQYVSGSAGSPQAGSASKNTLMIFGEPVYGDLDKDGDIDAATILVNKSPGSGTFYYAVFAINNGASQKTTNTILLGDRIAPQTVEIHDGRAVFNYAERKADEPMSAQPSVGKSVWVNLDTKTGEIGESIKDSEGESVAALTEADARAIAEKSCIKGGEALGVGTYNETTKTWWFDASLNAVKEGCNPACVVSENTKTAEINWRCTGLIAPKGLADEIQELFVEKYPKYAGTLSVSVDQEIGDYARGGVIFEANAPGGIFFVAKIDGKWKIIFDGNGQIPCNLASYGFPNEMLSDCAR